jgi:hypothetical protein
MKFYNIGPRERLVGGKMTSPGSKLKALACHPIKKYTKLKK